ncbi:RNA polymerase-binding protein RbpA [Demequina sp. NBRC 110055]|uniref:RNA polymerase-binding protein RbpA n=1 Tax=Demequina sp. NBRC 110055 TaxID=1570344 RepID=UPI0009FD6D43|nr:RNA polymerase-binding protein RbpA [Demequina sp. NBRC 110055]
MADRALRGMRLGTQSMEAPGNAELAERRDVHYDCPNGHIVTLPFSVEADVPLSWECHCGALALLRDGDRPADNEVKQQRTHWDMLLERRTIPELEELLDERLELLRAGRIGS